MRLLLLGNSYFLAPLRRLGFDAWWAGADPACDITLDEHDFDLVDLLSRLPFRPDAAVLTDDLGARVLPRRIRNADCPMIYYAVDAPINYFWQRHFARLFDLILVDQKAAAERLQSECSVPVRWLPVAVDTALYDGPVEEKSVDISFVGVINERVRPKRSAVIQALSRICRVETRGGRRGEWVSPREAAVLYRKSRLVLNENLFPGVTTRMLEAMASGTALFTDEYCDGLVDLFTPGEDLAVFSAEDMIQQAEHLLSSPGIRKDMAARGRAAVQGGHDITHRARRLAELAADRRGRIFDPDAGSEMDEGKALFLAGLRWPKPLGTDRLLRAESLLQAAADSMDAEALYYLGLIKRMKNDLGGAENDLRTAADAGFAPAWAAVGWIRLEQDRRAEARRAFRLAARSAGCELPNNFLTRSRPTAVDHVAAAAVMDALGHDLCPGFSRLRLHPALWTALEHYQEALRLEPRHVGALEGMGDLLVEHGAHNEAAGLLEQASLLAPRRSDLACKAEAAARRGYLRLGKGREAA